MDIWEQLKGESKRAYDNFKVYLELGSERTIKKTIKLTEKSASNIYRQFKKWNWEKRALEYDKFISNQNNKDDLIKKGFDKLKKSRFQQSLEFAETFKKLLDLIKEKIDIKQENIYKMELEEILKLSSSLSKTIPETIKALNC